MVKRDKTEILIKLINFISLSKSLVLHLASSLDLLFAGPSSIMGGALGKKLDAAVGLTEETGVGGATPAT